MKRVALFKSTENYWPRALLAIRSFEQWNPNWEVRVLNDGFETPYETHVHNGPNWLATCQYEGMLAALNDDAEQVLFIDSDTYTYGPYVEVEEALGQGASMLVTPHVTKPLPLERGSPSLQQIAKMGNYNAGFVGATHYAIPFLKFARDWTDAHPYIDDNNFIAAEQGWLRFAPDFDENTCVFRHPGYNYAYWNACTRALTQPAAGSWAVDGRPLRMVHFSGLEPGVPIEKLSRYQNRHRYGPETPEHQLFAEYMQKLQEATQKEVSHGQT